MPLDLYLITFLVLSIWILLSRVDRRVFERWGIEKGLLTLTWRTESGLKALEQIGRRFRRPITLLSTFAVAISIPILVLSFYSLVSYTQEVVATPETPSAIAPVIPGVHIEGAPIFIPLWYGIIALATVLFAHELSHGIVAAAEGIKVKSAGVISVTLLPLMAFVEPDDEMLEKSERKTKLRVFAAGSFGNFLAALSVFLLLVVVIVPLFFHYEMVVWEVVPGSPAAIAGLQENSTILSIEGIPIKSRGDFGKAVKGIKTGDTVTIETDKGVVTLETSRRPAPNTTLEGLIYELRGLEDRGYMGIISVAALKGMNPAVVSILGSEVPPRIYMQLVWIYLLNLLIGVTNLLPIFPLDGGRIFEEVAEGVFPRGSRQVTQTVFLLTFSLILINLGRFFNLL